MQLAYSTIGQGPPLMKTGNWMTHLEFDLESPIWRHLYRELARHHTLVRYDARGNGLSDRTVDEISSEAFVSDLEAVVDAAGLSRFALLGISQGCAVSIAYAVQHPERVSHLILYGGYALGMEQARPHRGPEGRGSRHAHADARGLGQGEPGLPPAVHLPVHPRWHQGAGRLVQRAAAHHGLAGEWRCGCVEANGEADVTALLPQVSVPTLVLHARDDARVPFEAGRRMAAGIPGARFVALPGRNHLFLESEPAFGQFLEHTRAFLAG